MNKMAEFPARATLASLFGMHVAQAMKLGSVTVINRSLNDDFPAFLKDEPKTVEHERDAHDTTQPTGNLKRLRHDVLGSHEYPQGKPKATKSGKNNEDDVKPFQ